MDRDMADWVKELFNYGTLGMLVAGLVWIIYAKIIPWGERYISSTETFLKAHTISARWSITR